LVSDFFSNLIWHGKIINLICRKEEYMKPRKVTLQAMAFVLVFIMLAPHQNWGETVMKTDLVKPEC
jgi:hypothetical protein